MREKKAERAHGYWYVVIVVQLLQFTGVCKFQSDYRHYIGYPRAIAVHRNNWPDSTLDSEWSRKGKGRGEEEEKGDRSPAMRTTGNNMSNCTMHNTRINTCSRKAAIVLLHGRVKWYDFVAMNNMKTEFASIDFSVNNVVSSPSFIFNLKLALSNHLFFLSSKFSSYTTVV